MTILSAVVPWVWAQEPVLPDPLEDPAPAPVFNSDRVLITTFQPMDEGSEADAARLFGLVSARLGQSNEVVPMSEVPRFEPQGYDGATYMRGCPPGKYGGCALVLGQRAGVDRALGATLRREVDEFENERTILLMTIFVVDVVEAREIASFGIQLDPAHEAEAIDGIARVFDDVVKGDYELRDLRQRGEAPDEAALEEARKERLALTLAALEDRLGDAVRSETIRTLPSRVTRADLLEYEQRDETPPWERVGMSQKQYLRYVNSGEDLQTWRRDGWGRFGKVVLRTSAGFGQGPWHQSYANHILYSKDDLQTVYMGQFLEVTNAGSASADLEVGFGVAPFVDVTFATVVRNGQTQYARSQSVQEEAFTRPPSEVRYPMTTWQYGVRGQFSPFPRWPARPTATVGLARWSGLGVPAENDFDRMESTNALLVEVMPGVEVDASPVVAFSARLVESVPVAGTFVRTLETGDPGTAEVPSPKRDYGPGIGLQAGITVRLGPVFPMPSPRTRTFDTGALDIDDEP